MLLVFEKNICLQATFVLHFMFKVSNTEKWGGRFLVKEYRNQNAAQLSRQ